MSESLPPTRIASIAAYSACSVSFASFAASSDGAWPPTNTVTAASPWNPSQIAPKSRESTIPSLSFLVPDGIPWTISSSIEVQIEAG